MKGKTIRKVRDYCHYIGEYRGFNSICKLKSSVPKKISVIFHNGSNYNYYVIIEELVEEFKKQFTCLGESTGKYITFTVPVETEVTRIDKMENKLQKLYLTYYNLLIVQDFMESSLSSLVNNHSEGTHKIKCK